MKKLLVFVLLVLFALTAFSFSHADASVKEKPEFVLLGGINMKHNTSLATEIVKAYPGALVINCSDSGLPISEMSKGRPVYEECVTRAKKAGYNIKALLIFQGEDDAINMQDAMAWREKFNKFVKDFSRDTKAGANTFVIYAQLGSVPFPLNADIWNTLKVSQSSNLKGHPFYRMIKTDDLGPYLPSNISFAESVYPAITARFMAVVRSVVKK